MTPQPDLFNYRPAPKYPYQAGAKDSDTGRAAARKVEGSGKAGRLRIMVLNALATHGQLTPDECADKCGEDILSIRPRFSELCQQGKIIKTDEKRSSHNGNPQAVYRLK